MLVKKTQLIRVYTGLKKANWGVANISDKNKYFFFQLVSLMTEFGTRLVIHGSDILQVIAIRI